jgi:hypothetical protein
MTSMIAEATSTTPAPAPGEKPKATKKAIRAPRRADVAKKKGKAGNKAAPAKKTPKTATRPKGARWGKAAKEKAVREGSKTETILGLLKRPGGVTAQELVKATGWQPHSVRGFLSGTIGNKMGLTLTSTKSEDGERSYSIKA